MNKTKLILRSLLLMLILWVVNEMVQQWPVHISESSQTSASPTLSRGTMQEFPPAGPQARKVRNVQVD